MNKRGKENCSTTILDAMPDIRSALQRGAAAYTHPEVRAAHGPLSSAPGEPVPASPLGTELSRFRCFRGHVLTTVLHV